MSDLVVSRTNIAPISDDDLANVRALETAVGRLEQVSIPTQHILHAGVYSRTVTVPAGVAITGALIKCATILIINGEGVAYLDGRPVEFSGYNVLTASARRKQAFFAKTDTDLTMIFATVATTVHAAEDRFTDEVDFLASRAPGAVNIIIVTGE